MKYMGYSVALLIVLDTETGGLDSREHSLLSVGMWTLDTVAKTIYNPLYFLVKEPNIITTPEAMKVNGLDLDVIDSQGLAPIDALKRICDYCWELCKVPRPVGHNVSFDMGFLQRLVRLTPEHRLKLPFNYRTIDVPSILYTMYLTGILPRDISSSQRALEYFGMERGTIHNALHDAECTGKVYLEVLKLITPIDSN